MIRKDEGYSCSVQVKIKGEKYAAIKLLLPEGLMRRIFTVCIQIFCWF